MAEYIILYSSNIYIFPQLLYIQLFIKIQIYSVKYTYIKFVVTNFDAKNSRQRDYYADKDVNMHTYTMTMNMYIIPNTLS